MADWASEGGHFYERDGTPRYTVYGANGRERPTTLRDAKVLNLLPSVSGIISCAAAPGLEAYKANQLMLAALTLPRSPDELEAAWIKRVKTDAKEHARKRAESGTAIHAAIEGHFRDSQPGVAFWPYVLGSLKKLNDVCGPQEWLSEKSFGSVAGYGGKCDLHSKEWVIDYKSKEFTSSDPTPELYDEHCMQVPAYAHGLALPNPRMGILWVSATEPGLVAFSEITPEQAKRGWEMFQALLSYWWARNETKEYRRPV